MTKNDNRILQLKEKIALKKEKIGEIKRFTPKTNCSLVIDDVRHNLHTLKKESLVFLLVKVNLYQQSAHQLGYEEEFRLGGFQVEDWMHDLKQKLSVLEQKEQLKELETMEEKLSTLLSEDKRVELELDEISELLQ